MQLRHRRLTGRFGLVVMGMALGTVFIGIALAIVNFSFSGSVSSNEFATTTTTLPPTTTTTLAPGDGLQAAISTSGGGPFPCQAAIDAGSLSLGAANIDLNVTSAQSPGELTLCVTNTLPSEITALTVQASVNTSAEVGCSDDERAVDPDGPTDCGLAGELENVIEVVLTPFNLDDLGCLPSPPAITPGGAAVSLLKPPGSGAVTLSQGLFCSWDISYRVSDAATYEGKLAASTDSIDLELVVSGSGS